MSYKRKFHTIEKLHVINEKKRWSLIINKGTEMPFTGKYLNFDGKGIYVCKREQFILR